jgi:4-diphosphocytidyl-2C-methyl-D-erythritol kinase
VFKFKEKNIYYIIYMRKKISITTTTVYDKTYTKRSGSKKEKIKETILLKKQGSLSINKIHEKKVNEINNVCLRKNALKNC